MSLIQIPRPTVSPEGTGALRHLDQTAHVAGQAEARAWGAVSDIGAKVERIALGVEEWQRRKDDLLGANVSADLKMEMDTWENEQFTRGDLHVVDPKTKETGYDSAPFAYREYLKSITDRAAQQLPGRMQSRWRDHQSLRNKEALTGFTDSIFKMRTDNEVRQIKDRTRVLASGITTTTDPETGEEKAFPIPGGIDPRAAMDYMKIALPNIPTAEQLQYIKDTHIDVAEGLMSRDPASAIRFLDGAQSAFDPATHMWLRERAVNRLNKRDAEYQMSVMENLGQLAVGDPSKGIGSKPQAAIQYLDDSVSRISDKRQQRSFTRNGLKEIATAILTEDAPSAISFLNIYKSRFESRDWRTMMNTAVEARDAVSTEEERRKKEVRRLTEQDFTARVNRFRAGQSDEDPAALISEIADATDTKRGEPKLDAVAGRVLTEILISSQEPTREQAFEANVLVLRAIGEQIAGTKTESETMAVLRENHKFLTPSKSESYLNVIMGAMEGQSPIVKAQIAGISRAKESFDVWYPNSTITPAQIPDDEKERAAILEEGLARRVAEGDFATRIGAWMADRYPEEKNINEMEVMAKEVNILYAMQRERQPVTAPSGPDPWSWSWSRKQIPAPAAGYQGAWGVMPSGKQTDLRPDGTVKGPGYFGALTRRDGKVSTELSIGVEFDGKETQVPTLVPTLTAGEIGLLLSGGKPTDEIVNKAVTHAKERLAAGKSPFAQEGEQEPASYEDMRTRVREMAKTDKAGAKSYYDKWIGKFSAPKD